MLKQSSDFKNQIRLKITDSHFHEPLQSLTDAIIGFVESNGRFFIMDMWTTGYLQPILESSQDLTNMEGAIEDGFTTLKFTRKRNTGDNQDVAFTDDKRKQLGYTVLNIKIFKFGCFNSLAFHGYKFSLSVDGDFRQSVGYSALTTK